MVRAIGALSGETLLSGSESGIAGEAGSEMGKELYARVAYSGKSLGNLTKWLMEMQ